MDLTATILAATGAMVPKEARLDGMNLLPVLGSSSQAVERTLFWRVSQRGFVQQAVRSGPWKLLLDDGRPLLFNLRTDIAERENLIGRHTEVAQRLRGLLATWQAEVDAAAKQVGSR